VGGGELMKTLVKMQFGSHVYGTNVSTSDHDYKAVHLPEGRDILLQRPKNTINIKTKVDGTKKNTAEDVDFESFSVQQYLKLLLHISSRDHLSHQ
jgi:predicted nucleotidyltransferase